MFVLIKSSVESLVFIEYLYFFFIDLDNNFLVGLNNLGGCLYIVFYDCFSSLSIAFLLASRCF
jgi:hypothetical protein